MSNVAESVCTIAILCEVFILCKEYIGEKQVFNMLQAN